MSSIHHPKGIQRPICRTTAKNRNHMRFPSFHYCPAPISEHIAIRPTGQSSGKPGKLRPFHIAAPCLDSRLRGNDGKEPKFRCSVRVRVSYVGELLARMDTLRGTFRARRHLPPRKLCIELNILYLARERLVLKT